MRKSVLSMSKRIWRIRTVDKKYSFFIGRFQPLHDGHKELIQAMLDDGKNVCVAIMNTCISTNNPYTVEQRINMLTEAFGDKIKVITIPPIDEVCYGRDVGYNFRRLSGTHEEISASEIRGERPVRFFGDEDFEESYKRVAEKVHHLMAIQGFWSEGSNRNVCNPIALAHSELSEALECLRLGNPPDKNISEMSGAEVQLSDVLGILMDIEVGYGFDISKALLKKMEFNKTRGYLHGKKF